MPVVPWVPNDFFCIIFKTCRVLMYFLLCILLFFYLQFFNVYYLNNSGICLGKYCMNKKINKHHLWTLIHEWLCNHIFFLLCEFVPEAAQTPEHRFQGQNSAAFIMKFKSKYWKHGLVHGFISPFSNLLPLYIILAKLCMLRTVNPINVSFVQFWLNAWWKQETASQKFIIHY